MSKGAKKGRTRVATGKVKFLAVLDAQLIKRLKVEAIEQGSTASAILEAGLSDWVRRNRGRRPEVSAKIPAAAKRQFLAQLDPSLIREVKIMALDLGVKASTLVGEAAARWIDQKKRDLEK